MTILEMNENDKKQIDDIKGKGNMWVSTKEYLSENLFFGGGNK